MDTVVNWCAIRSNDSLCESLLFLFLGNVGVGVLWAAVHKKHGQSSFCSWKTNPLLVITHSKMSRRWNSIRNHFALVHSQNGQKVMAKNVHLSVFSDNNTHYILPALKDWLFCAKIDWSIVKQIIFGSFHQHSMQLRQASRNITPSQFKCKSQ